MDVEGPFIAPSAHKHDVSDEDILHVIRNPTDIDDPDDGNGYITFYGPDYAGNPLEVGAVVSDDGVLVIVHAMSDQRPQKIR